LALRVKGFQVSDLPGPLDDSGKIVLAQRLIREGMLVRLNGRAPEGSGSRSTPGIEGHWQAAME
jgi:hypothetical protein